MRRLLAAIAAVSMFPALAADVAPEPAKATDKPICHRNAPATGSTMPGKRVCKTAAEWKALELAQQRDRTPASIPAGMQQEPFTPR